MTKHDRISRIFAWIVILIALIWMCLFAVPQFVDRISRHEDYWLKQGFEHAGTP